MKLFLVGGLRTNENLILLATHAMKPVTFLFAVLVYLWSHMAQAHEVVPSVVEIEIGEKQAQLTFHINAEALLADIDLSNIDNTNDAANADMYDQFRALPNTEMENAIRNKWDALGKKISLIVRNRAIALQLEQIVVTEEPNMDFPRDTKIVARADLPSNTTEVRFSWAPEYGTVGIRQKGVEKPYVAIIDGGDISDPIAVAGSEPRGLWERFFEYIPIGFIHIVPAGLDHILFVLGLFFFSLRLRPLILQVSVFTVAHTVSLALGTLGIITFDAAIVEPFIAASIVYVACENIFLKHQNLRLRLLLVFIFGIVHGFGFASVLDAFGLPADHFIAALLGFNIGVELGQIAVLCCAFVLTFWAHKKDWYHAHVVVPCSLLIATVGIFWCVERVFF